MNAEKRIYRLFASCIFLVIISLIIPRFTAGSNGGFAAATQAALSFLLSLGIALIMSIYMLVFTIKNIDNISVLSKFLGIIPGIVLAVVLIVLIIFVSSG